MQFNELVSYVFFVYPFCIDMLEVASLSKQLTLNSIKSTNLGAKKNYFGLATEAK